MTRRELMQGTASGLAAAILTRSDATGAAQRFNLLDSDGSALIVAGTEDRSTADYFNSVFEDLTGRKLDVGAGVPENNRPLILIGDVLTNARIRNLAGPSILSRLTDEGILLATTHDRTHPVLLVAGGSRAATPGAAGELLNYHLNASPGHAWVDPLNLLDNPALQYRILWNWDHSTNWVRGVRGEQEDGCVNPYLKAPASYRKDFEKVLDYMGEHKLNGLALWGFLRDSHGGVEQSKSLVEHAWRRGVHVLPGIGTSFYGGVYYEGQNRFNVNSWLADNPAGLRFLDQQGKRLANAICPSKPENLRWLREGGEWLFSEFPHLGGANLENGDFFVCQTEDCRASRERSGNDPNFYYDMLTTQMPIIEGARKHNPAAWMTYATYTGFNEQEIWKHTDPKMIRSKFPRFVSAYPEDAICQWTYTSMVEGWGRDPEAVVRSKWPSGLRPPTKRSIGLLHQGSQWHRSDVWWTRSPRGNSTGERYVDISELIRYTCSRCSEEGLQGVEILGEVSDASPANELNYMAFEEFTWHPRKTMDEFVRDRLSKAYGSVEDARRFLRMVQSTEKSLPVLLHDANLAGEIGGNRQLNSRQRRRWTNLKAEIMRRISLLV